MSSAIIERNGRKVIRPEKPSPIDKIEAHLIATGNGELRPRGGHHETAPVVNRFTPGLYLREIHMPRGAVVTSEIHRTEHPYVVSQGKCLVYLENEGRWEQIEAPHTGITYPGTRRLLIILRDTIWTTFHVTESTDVAQIEQEILVPYENPLFDYSGEVPKLMEGTA